MDTSPAGIAAERLNGAHNDSTGNDVDLATSRACTWLMNPRAGVSSNRERAADIADRHVLIRPLTYVTTFSWSCRSSRTIRGSSGAEAEDNTEDRDDVTDQWPPSNARSNSISDN